MFGKREKSDNPLWTRDFTILTLGSVVSMLGNALSGFALSLLVLDYTQSSLYYAIYLAVFTLPQIIMPIFFGAVLDRFSRRKMIYTLDFISAGLMLTAAIVLHSGFFNFTFLAIFCFLLGSISSVYTVAYQSFYPLLITPGNYEKAYSMSSMLETLATVMVPVSAFTYNAIGIVPLFTINSVCFLIAAIMETRIRANEGYIQKSELESKHFLTNIKEGFQYLLQEKGLLAIAIYFTFSALAYGASSVIALPYFKENYVNGEYMFMLVMGMSVLGRTIGGAILYRIKLPTKYKYIIVFNVYLITAFLEGFFLYFSVPVMMVMCLVSGLMGVTSYNIRISATQNYVPDEKKGRFNGAFTMLNTVGSLAGELITGVLTVYLPVRAVLAGFMMLCAVAGVVFIGGNRKSVKAIYNREL